MQNVRAGLQLLHLLEGHCCTDVLDAIQSLPGLTSLRLPGEPATAHIGWHHSNSTALLMLLALLTYAVEAVHPPSPLSSPACMLPLVLC